MDTLYQIQVLTIGFIESKRNFGGLVPDELSYGGDGKEAKFLDDAGSSHFPFNMNLLQKPQHSSPLIKSLPKRLKWATCSKERYEKLISGLREFNDVLIDLVDSEARIAIRKTTRETDMTILHLHSRVDDILQLFKALLSEKASFPAVRSSSACQGEEALHAQKRELAGLAYFKAVNTSIEDNTSLACSGSLIERKRTPATRLQRSDIHLLNDLEEGEYRWEAEYHQSGKPIERVWVEWRANDPITEAQPALNPSRVDKLVSLLSDTNKPDLLRVPHCIGYFDETGHKENSYRRGRLGFVFERPSPKSAGPVSLRALIRSRTKPVLTERINLAKAIANCLMSLHSVNWLHKGIRSQNVLFFLEDGNIIDYSNPYISGFGYARPAFREDMTEMVSEDPAVDMYRHPRTHGLGPWEGRPGFKRTFDIYSLGLLLVEIATWQTLETVLGLGDPSRLSTSDLRDIQKRMLDEKRHLESVGANAGVKFCYATRNCLDSMVALGVNHLDDETNVQVAAKVSQSFYHQVLLPLEEIQI